MEKYPKLFIVSAISYLLLAVILGFGFVIGYADPSTSRFIHIHLGLLGFMAMFIYGVAYHILPRFNAKPLTYPVLVRVHFYLVNFGLAGMVFFAYAGGLYGEGLPAVGFAISAGAEAFGIFIFAFNVIPVMLPVAPPKLRPTPEPTPEPKPAVTSDVPQVITPDMKVSRVLDDYPQLLDTFVSNSFKALANPVARATFAKAVTIERACKLHKVDMEAFINKLNVALESGETASPQKTMPAQVPQQKAETAATTGKTIKRGESATAETLVGSLLETYSEVKPVFEKHYGSGCFSCPGQAFETIGQTATMHGIEEEMILGEINEKIRSALDGAKPV